MKYRYYIIDTGDASVRATNSSAIAEDAVLTDQFVVIDVLENKDLMLEIGTSEILRFEVYSSDSEA